LYGFLFFFDVFHLVKSVLTTTNRADTPNVGETIIRVIIIAVKVFSYKWAKNLKLALVDNNQIIFCCITGVMFSAKHIYVTCRLSVPFRVASFKLPVKLVLSGLFQTPYEQRHCRPVAQASISARLMTPARQS